MGFFVPLENFSLKWKLTMTDEGWNFFTYARHLWQFSSEGSLACRTYTRHTFIMVISGPVTLTPTADRLAVELLLPGFTRVCRAWDSITQPSACALTHCATAAATSIYTFFKS